MNLEYKIINKKYQSIKQILKEEFHISDRLLLKIKNNKKILKNNENCSINIPINLGDTISIDLNYNEDNSNIVPTKMDLDIIYEDEWLLVINKPAGIAVHPSCNHFENSLSNGIKFYFDSINLKKKIRIVNRLDKDTSGIVIFAKCEYIQEELIKQMKDNIFKKEYLGIVQGILTTKTGTINVPIARKENSIIERCIDINGDLSITHYKVLKEINDYSLVHFILETGRTHQIRVHTRYIGHPILGDTLYGIESSLINRQALHSYKIKFIHPITKEKCVFIAKIPEDIFKLL